MQIWIFLKQKQICIFLRCRSEFFLNKKWIYIFIRCRSEFFSNQKLICILLRYKSDFSLTYVDFETKEKIKHDCVYGCLVLFGSYSINLCYEWNSLHKKNIFIYFLKKHIKTYLIFFVIKNLFFFHHKTDLIFYKLKNHFFSTC